MSCLPKSGGCEWKHIRPFIEGLNRTEGTSFQLAQCLDQTSRNRPEPEVRCTQTNGGLALVVERKSVVWPLNYAARHNRDHEIADGLSDDLNSLVGSEPYAVNLDIGFDGTRKQAKDFVKRIVTQVTNEFGNLADDEELKDTFAGHQWQFCRETKFERDDDDPLGLVVRWNLSHNSDMYTNPPPALFHEIQRMIDGAAKKFQNYLDHRRTLLVIPQGEVPSLEQWWREVLVSRVSVPTFISDIWMAWEEWEETEGYVWLFKKVWPRQIQPEERAG